MVFVEVALGSSTQTTLAEFLSLACLNLVKCIGYASKYSIQILSAAASLIRIGLVENSRCVGAAKIYFVTEHASFQTVCGLFYELGKAVVG